ncbi:hypothetical protein KJ632_05695 [Patescibacteria group bacterium]|nr:hypothetical protein [Patescibacteria group bacterium]
MRVHRSLIRRARGINPTKVANRAEDYLTVYAEYRSYLREVKELANEQWFKQQIKKVDKFEAEILKLEDKIERLEERRAIEAAKLEEELEFNLDLLKDYLRPEEYKDFK